MTKTSLRILFLNSENLFSPDVSFYGSRYTQDEYEEKIDWMANFIADKQVHLVGLTEVGEQAEDCIGDLLAKVNAANQGAAFDYFALGQPSRGSTKIRNAVISQFPILEQDSLVSFPDDFTIKLINPGASYDDPDNWQSVPYDQFNRPVFRTLIQLPRYNVNFFVVHLKSKRPKLSSIDDNNEAIGIARSAIMRNAEAAALRFYFDTFLPNQYNTDPEVPTILVGDFNDVPMSVPVENIMGPFDKKIGPAYKWSEPDKRRLISCARMHLKNDAYDDKLFSYIHEENFSLIDQGFVSQHLTSKFKRMEMYNDHVLRHQMMSRQTTEEAQQWKSKASDHGAFVLEFVRVL